MLNVVLVVTASYDETASLVERKLESRGANFFRLDTDRFPMEVAISIRDGGKFVIESGSGRVESDEIGAVWYRRHVDPLLPEDLDDGIRSFCSREARACLDGLFHSVVGARWLSDPLAVVRAERKPFQLAVAGGAGFELPPTLLSNNPVSVRDFALGRRLIAKAVSSGYIETPEGNRAIFTSPIQESDLDDLDGLTLSPVIFQELVPKLLDLRVTVVGDKLFAAEILSQDRPASRIDWRATDDPELKHQGHDLPEAVATACRRLVSRLGLGFGAIDLALTPDGRYVFFEINPNGEWAWIEHRLGYPISDAIADFLVTARH